MLTPFLIPSLHHYMYSPFFLLLQQREYSLYDPLPVHLIIYNHLRTKGLVASIILLVLKISFLFSPFLPIFTSISFITHPWTHVKHKGTCHTPVFHP